MTLVAGCGIAALLYPVLPASCRSGPVEVTSSHNLALQPAHVCPTTSRVTKSNTKSSALTAGPQPQLSDLWSLQPPLRVFSCPFSTPPSQWLVGEPSPFLYAGFQSRESRTSSHGPLHQTPHRCLPRLLPAISSSPGLSPSLFLGSVQ